MTDQQKAQGLQICWTSKGYPAKFGATTNAKDAIQVLRDATPCFLGECKAVKPSANITMAAIVCDGSVKEDFTMLRDNAPKGGWTLGQLHGYLRQQGISTKEADFVRDTAGDKLNIAHDKALTNKQLRQLVRGVRKHFCGGKK